MYKHLVASLSPCFKHKPSTRYQYILDNFSVKVNGANPRDTRLSVRQRSGYVQDANRILQCSKHMVKDEQAANFVAQSMGVQNVAEFTF